MRIYFDCCALSRPFDDQRQERIRFETEAFLQILGHIRTSGWRLLSSEVHLIEFENVSVAKGKEIILGTYLRESSWIRLNAQIEERAETLERMGFGDFDALHLASAESGGADVFLTTDDGILKRAEKHSSEMRTQVRNPNDFWSEVVGK